MDVCGMLKGWTADRFHEPPLLFAVSMMVGARALDQPSGTLGANPASSAPSLPLPASLPPLPKRRPPWPSVPSRKNSDN
jgi:hypothetical protein